SPPRLYAKKVKMKLKKKFRCGQKNLKKIPKIKNIIMGPSRALCKKNK
uniref:Uncharacterized protein n=1 Tax=Amphimedon queenslandica TaxID=400682 RepID=A0A1X7SKU4_AMPQE